MQKELIAQLRAKHNAALACLTLVEHSTDADMKNTAGEWYESFLIDIVEMQVPESEKPVYYNLNMDEKHNAIVDEVLSVNVYQPVQRETVKINPVFHY